MGDSINISGNSGSTIIVKSNLANVGINAPPTPEALAEAEALLAELPTDRVPDVAPLPTPHRMPLRANPLFVGRVADLQALAGSLKAGTTTVVAAVAGMGGVGKTQLASEFAHRYGQYFAGGVFWLSFAEANGVDTEIALCGEAMGLSLKDRPLPEVVRTVRQAWENELPRLLVFDNCEDEQLLHEYAPSSGGCRVLLTSRRHNWDATLGVACHALGVLPRAESIDLVRRFRPDLVETDDGRRTADDRASVVHRPSFVVPAPPHNQATSDLDALAAEIGDLPLALHLAGSFLKQYPATTPTAYLAELKAIALDHESLQGAGLTISATDHDLSVARTIKLSYDKLAPANADDALALALLARAAYFAPGEPLPRDLLLKTVELADTAAERRATRALARLVNLGLIDAEPEAALRLHRLIAAYTLETAGDAEARAAVEQVMNDVADELNRAGYPAALVELETHLRYLTDRAFTRNDQEAATLCTNLGYHLLMIANYFEAPSYLERALEIRHNIHGMIHPVTALSLNNIGNLLQDKGDLAGAYPYYEQALAIYEQALGAMHPETARILNNLGTLLQAQGDLAAAQPYFERALAIREQMLGPSHPDTATSLNNLGSLLQAQGNLVAARPYFEWALAIREQVLGAANRKTATTLNNLGGLLHAQGDLAAARPYFERALAIREQVLGPSHPDTATSLNNLGGLLQAQGDLVGARPYLERALATREAVQGTQHPDTATSLNNLGTLLQARGDLAGARSYYERALAILERVLGPEHPNTQTVRRNLAALEAPPVTREQQIERITAEAAQAVQAVRDLGNVAACAELAAQLEAQAQWAEDGEAEDSPYLTLAARLRALAAELAS